MSLNARMRMTTHTKVTRGYGLFEGFLARQRAGMANKLIPGSHRCGRILDIGCGEYPFFLMNTEFHERCGMDKIIHEECIGRFKEQSIILTGHDMERNDILPFPSGSFDVITMLAVFEHIEPERIVPLLREIRRILMPSGVFIMTTPAAWTEGLLRVLAALRLVSHDEIEEHKAAYTRGKIRDLLREAGFPAELIETGYFEIIMNIWAKAASGR